MRSSATSTRLTPLKLKSSSTRYTGGSAETCRTIVPRASCTFWLNPTPWIVSPLRFTLTRWFGSSTSEPPQEHFDLLLGLEIAGPLSHARAAAGPRLAGPVGNLDGERAEPVERGGAQERGEGGRVLGGTLQRLPHLVRVAARVAREVLENQGGEVVELLGELGRPRHRQDLLVDGRGLRVAGDGRGAEGGVAEHPERRGERFLGGGRERLGMEGPRGEQDEGEHHQDSHTPILTPLRGLL